MYNIFISTITITLGLSVFLLSDSFALLKVTSSPITFSSAIKSLLTGNDLVKCAISPDQKILAVATNHGEVIVGNPQTGRLTLLLEKHRTHIEEISFSPDGSLLMVQALHPNALLSRLDEPFDADHDYALTIWKRTEDNNFTMIMKVKHLVSSALRDLEETDGLHSANHYIRKATISHDNRLLAITTSQHYAAIIAINDSICKEITFPDEGLIIPDQPREPLSIDFLSINDDGTYYFVIGYLGMGQLWQLTLPSTLHLVTSINMNRANGKPFCPYSCRVVSPTTAIINHLNGTSFCTLKEDEQGRRSLVEEQKEQAAIRFDTKLQVGIQPFINQSYRLSTDEKSTQVGFIIYHISQALKPRVAILFDPSIPFASTSDLCEAFVDSKAHIFPQRYNGFTAYNIVRLNDEGSLAFYILRITALPSPLTRFLHNRSIGAPVTPVPDKLKPHTLTYNPTAKELFSLHPFNL